MPTQITIDHVSDRGSRPSSVSDEGSGVHVSHSGSGSGGYPLSEHPSSGGPWEPLPYPHELHPEDSASRLPGSAASHRPVEPAPPRTSTRGRSSRHRVVSEREGVEYRHRITHPGSPESVDSGEDFVGHYARPGGPAHRHSSYGYGYTPSTSEPYAQYPPVPSTQMIQSVPPQPYGYNAYHQPSAPHGYYHPPSSVSGSVAYPNHFSPPPVSYGNSGYFPPYGAPYAIPPGGYYPHYGHSTPSPKIPSPPATGSSEEVKALRELLEKQTLASNEAFEKHRTFLEERDKAKEAELKRIADEKAAAEARAASDKKIADEATAAAEAKAAAKLAEAEAKAKEELAKAEAEAKEGLKKAEAEAEEKLKKQKEEAEKETEKQVAAAKAPPPGKKAPIKFKDAIGRKYQFPFEMCCKWNNMEELIRQAFMHVDGLAQHVYDGHYDLSGPTGEIILRDCWESTVEPDWTITMHMWPVPEPEPTKDELDAALEAALLAEAAAKAPKKGGKKGAKISVVQERKKKGTSKGHGPIPVPPPPPMPPPSMLFDDPELFGEVPHIIDDRGPDERPKKAGSSKRAQSGLLSSWMSGSRAGPSKPKKK